MSLLGALLAVCLLRCPCALGYEDEIEVNYADSYYNEITDGEQREGLTTPSPCQGQELTRWDKLFVMIEDSQMRENMLLHYVDDIIKAELQSLRGEVRRLLAGHAGTCSGAADTVGRRLATQMEQKVEQGMERVRTAAVEQAARQDAALQQLLEAGRNQAARLGKLETGCLSGAGLGAKTFAAPHKQQDVTTSEVGQVEKALAAMAVDLQRVQAQLSLSQRWAAQHFLPSGCETALLFPMRSRRIYAAVNPDAPMSLRSFTVCLWAKATEALNKTVLFSYGTRRNPYEIQLLLSRRVAQFTVGGEAHLVEAREAAPEGRWVHLCGAWSSEQGLASLWVNGKQAASSPGVAEGHALPEGGVMQLGQEKNGCCGFGFDGGFDAKLAFAGKMTGVNVWDRVLGAEEIAQQALQEGSCNRRGNVVCWGVSEIVPHGGAQYIN
ncbi:hypothetical protein MATL_G00242170 [Megalops atlanticus]|uniref:Pentraxin-related protein PTX3 n=1 Tax=Megalops atlanticus TaxID=7932 RepID=A0A9D3PDY6_MEGAT|nr:hypothetical protein MATL_G00242170 [Megalops atlanticus]